MLPGWFAVACPRHANNPHRHAFLPGRVGHCTCFPQRISEGREWRHFASVLCLLTFRIAGQATLVAGDCRIDDGGPMVDAARERLDLLEALLPEPHGDIERTCPMVTDDNDVGVGV